MKNYFSENLENLIVNNNISQRTLAETLGVSNTAISRYLKKENEPSSSLLLCLKEKFDIDIDDFLTKKVEFKNRDIKEDISFSEKYDEKFIGNYLIYYYNNTFYKGKVDYLAYNTLKYGVLSIFKNREGNTEVGLNLFKSRTEAENYKTGLDSMDFEEIETEFSKPETYRGTIEFNFTQIFITFSNEIQNDKALLILNNPPTERNYIGGLGTINSVSKGREMAPCVQFVLISKYILKKSEGELYSLLGLKVSDINVKNEAEQLLKLFKNLYLNEDNQSLILEEYQKMNIIENSLENVMRELIDANIFRYAKVSNSEDDDFYRLIKEEIKK